jgi:ABC-type transporter Mla MlaB component
MEHYFSGASDGFRLEADRDGNLLKIRLSGFMIDAPPQSRLAIVRSFMALNTPRRYAVVQADLSNLAEIDSPGLAALREILRLGDDSRCGSANTLAVAIRRHQARTQADSSKEIDHASFE